MSFGWGVAAISVALVGCGGNDTTSFPPGLEPLEECTAPEPDGAQPYPEAIAVARGRSGHHWVHARAYVRAPLAEVWPAMRDPVVSVDRRAVDRWSVTEDVEPAYDYSYRIRNEVDDLVTVEFDITWRHGLVEGEAALPAVVAGRWQKTWGTTFIQLLQGSVVARAAADDATELEFVEHLRATAGSADEIESYLRDYYASIRARAHGEPLPEY